MPPLRNLIKVRVTEPNGNVLKTAVSDYKRTPLWDLWAQCYFDASMMLCPKGSTTPCQDLHVDLSRSAADPIEFDAHEWTDEWLPLRQQVRELAEPYGLATKE